MSNASRLFIQKFTKKSFFFGLLFGHQWIMKRKHCFRIFAKHWVVFALFISFIFDNHYYQHMLCAHCFISASQIVSSQFLFLRFDLVFSFIFHSLFTIKEHPNFIIYYLFIVSNAFHCIVNPEMPYLYALNTTLFRFSFQSSAPSLCKYILYNGTIWID